MFDPTLEGRILFIDLSTTIVGSLDEMAGQSGICITKDFYHGTPSQSILLYDGGDFAISFERFREDPDEWIALGDKHRAPDFYDQVLMNHTPIPHMRYWQDVLPGQVVSWRLHCAQAGVPEGARIIKFHGSPKPWEVHCDMTPRTPRNPSG